jgi:hypothetical protein
MKNFISIFILLLGLTASQVMAVPNLQLTIEGGTYNTITETTDTDSSVFSLYAILNPDKGKDPQSTLSGNYRLSISVVNPSITIPAYLGSFTINNDPAIQVTGDMLFGIPPIELVNTTPPYNIPKKTDTLPTHDIYPTFYKDIEFNFVQEQQTSSYDVITQGNIGIKPPSGTGAFWQEFKFDVSKMTASLHFDLYQLDVNNNIIAFAPFSHDAEDGPASKNVPEPQGLTLLGLGLIASFFALRRSNRQA